MKYVLVIDADEKKIDDGSVIIIGSFGIIADRIRPLPEIKDISYPNDNYNVGFADGWDACLKEITGETE